MKAVNLAKMPESIVVYVAIFQLCKVNFAGIAIPTYLAET